MLNEPTGGDFHHALIVGVMGYFRVLLLKCLKLFARDDRVFEETAGTAKLFYVGKFGVTDGADGVVKLPKCRICNAMLLKIGPDVAVFQI